MFFWIASCTSGNPNYSGTVDTRPSNGDAGSDGSAGEQGLRDGMVDAAPVCVNDEQCDDRLPCTTDSCDQVAGKCQFVLASGWCWIDGACFQPNEQPPTDSCRYCDPARDAVGWSAKGDREPCESDGLDCTADLCQNGSCTHPVTSGCLIDGSCVAEGDSGDDPCSECRSTTSATQLTFMSGKPCPPKPPGVAGTCVAASGCRTWYSAAPLSAEFSDSFNAVTQTPDSKIWAAGGVENNGNTYGVLTQLPLGSGNPNTLLATNEMLAMHHRVAVAAGGEVWRHNGATWTASAALQQATKGIARASVWSATVAGKQHYLLGGVRTPTEPALIYCAPLASGFNCVEQAGFGDAAFGSEAVGAVFATVSQTGALGPSWALTFGQWEDIYYSSVPPGTLWTRNSPHGCLDKPPTSACSDAGHYTDLFAASKTDVWAVGTQGLLLHYNGVWTALTQQFPNQQQYELTAVFASEQDKLVTVAAHRDTFSGRTVVVFNYNVQRDEWFGPIELLSLNNTAVKPRINDIGGPGYGDLWMVGQRPRGNLGQTARAWTLQLK